MGKNIVICCDGTGSEYGRDEDNTNVARLFELLIPDDHRQISYYDPGIGTYSPLRTSVFGWLEKQLLMASGQAIDANILKAYKYLMDYFEPEDRIFLFGFSRGAHTVRELANLIRRCGLLTKGSENLIPYAVKIWRSGDESRMDRFRDTFSRRSCRPYFMGAWDTVAAVGWLLWRKYYEQRRPSRDISYGYHALAIDESRWYFRVSDWDEREIVGGQTIEQVWFAGSHGDVGGQGGERRTSDISLRWMVQKATAVGLLPVEGWEDRLNPDIAGEISSSRRFFWRFPRGKERSISDGAKVHVSVGRRMEIRGDYKPENLLKAKDLVEVD